MPMVGLVGGGPPHGCSSGVTADRQFSLMPLIRPTAKIVGRGLASSAEISAENVPICWMCVVPRTDDPGLVGRNVPLATRSHIN
jgi:hypothetical protein